MVSLGHSIKKKNSHQQDILNKYFVSVKGSFQNEIVRQLLSEIDIPRVQSLYCDEQHNMNLELWWASVRRFRGQEKRPSVQILSEPYTLSIPLVSAKVGQKFNKARLLPWDFNTSSWAQRAEMYKKEAILKKRQLNDFEPKKRGGGGVIQSLEEGLGSDATFSEPVWPSLKPMKPTHHFQPFVRLKGDSLLCYTLFSYLHQWKVSAACM